MMETTLKRSASQKPIDYWSFQTSHFHSLQKAFDSVSRADVEATAELLFEGIQERSFFVAGNGGSAAIANHFVCDWLKSLITVERRAGNSIMSLSQSPEVITATANDYSFDKIFTRQLSLYASPGDILLIVSSSGNSPNVIDALQWARENGLLTVALTGFDGGVSAKLAHVGIHVPSSDYGIVEDCHQIIMHCMAKYIVEAFGRESQPS